MTNSYIYIPDLVADMAECDANYIRLCRLFPDMDSEEAICFGIQARAAEVITVNIRVRERCPFTTMVSIDVMSERGQPHVRWPSLDLRVYQDVKSAEVIRFERHRNFHYRYSIPNEHMFQPDEKSQVNKYLGELLDHCIEHGYSLEPVEFS